MPKLEVTLKVDKVTKGAVRYREAAIEEVLGLPVTSPVFPVIYIRNEALKLLGSTHPDTIKVTVEVV